MSNTLEKWYLWNKKTEIKMVTGIIQCGKKLTLKGRTVLNPRNVNARDTITAYTLGEKVESKRVVK